MALIQEGILGFAFGRVGLVIGYRRNGQNILRTSKNSGGSKKYNCPDCAKIKNNNR